MVQNDLVCSNHFLKQNSFIFFQLKGIGRVLIPRFFRTLFDGGVNEVYFQLKQTKEIFHNTTLSLDCEQASMITCFGKPPHIKVCTEGHLILEYTFDDLMRIKSWHFAIKQFRELIPRSIVAIPVGF